MSAASPRLVFVLRSLACLFLTAASMHADDAPPLQAGNARELQTVAEESDFTATATYDQVMALARKLDEASEHVHLTSFGQSQEGRDLPLLIIADPPLQSAQEVRQSGKTIVFALGNIHGGEVCGKEALLMLTRDLSQPEPSPLLKELVVLVAPIYNADGNEQISKDHRRDQRGPEEGVGQRENAQGLDLNRDHVKLKSSEARSLARLLTEYNPHIVVDTHATNGSRHGYTITYDGPRHPATPTALIELTRDDILPAVAKRLEEATGYRSFFYGNFSDSQDRWETYPAWLRYNTQYAGVRGHLPILSEAYAYASYRDRVLATRAFVQAILEESNERGDALRADLRKVRDELARGGGADEQEAVAIASRMVPLPEPVRILAAADDDEGIEPPPGSKSALTMRTIPFLGAAVATESVQAPWAYLIPATSTAVLENLRNHGVELQVLREDRSMEVERNVVHDWSPAARPYQGQHPVTAQATTETARVSIPAGTVVARTDQQLGRLLVNLLEPESEDGLVTWNFFDSARPANEPKWEFPVYRMMNAQPLLTSEFRDPDDSPRRKLTYDDVHGARPVNFSGHARGDVKWLADGEHFTQWRQDRLWKFHARTGDAQELFDRDALAMELASAAKIEQTPALAAIAPWQLTVNDDSTAAITQIDGDYYYLVFDPPTVTRLTSTDKEEELLSFSPDGTTIAFVRDFDLYAIDLATGRERRLTRDGTRLVRHGKADWVYFEEIYHRSWRAYRWSPDSRSIAFMEFDDRPVHEFTVLRHLSPRGFVETERYPKAGDPIPQVRLGVVPVQGGRVTWIPLNDYSPDNRILTRYGWLPDSKRLFVMIQDRAQKWLDYCHVHRNGSGLKRLMRLRSSQWVDDPGDPDYLSDQSFLLSGEQDGWRHIYHWNADGSLRRQVTKGDWEVRSLDAIDEDEGWLYLQGMKDSTIASHGYRVKLDGSELSRLTPDDADHQATFAPKGQQFVVTYSNMTQPSRVVLRDSGGEWLRTMDTNPIPDLDRFQLGEMNYFEIPLSDGTTIPGTLLYPPDFDPSKKYPVWLTTYGGPHAPSVTNRWNDGRKADQLLAAQGILVFRCDPRSASGRGAVSTWIAYEQLGVTETRDLEEAVTWLAQRPYIDAARIGLSGYSYGGYLTAYVMTHSKKFSAGIAGAPVTDWRNYDAFYTERFMNTPQENPDGYEKSSVVKAAKDLHGSLLLIHGSMDDNVHVQNTLQLAHELQEQDIPFEMMIYPTSRHGIHSRHFQRLSYDFILRTMLGDGAKQESSSGQPVAKDSRGG